MRWARSSRNSAAVLAAFFFLMLPPPFAIGESGTAQLLPLDPEPLVIETQSGPKSYLIEIADDASERATGMMFRKTAPPERGMLFNFGRTRLVTIWMRNTLVPLDILFIGEDLRIVRISAYAEPLSLEHIGSGEPVRFALELAAGVAKRDGLREGDMVRHPAMAAGMEKALGE